MFIPSHSLPRTLSILPFVCKIWNFPNNVSRKLGTLNLEKYEKNMERQVLQSGKFPWVVSGFPQLPFTFWKTSYLDFGLLGLVFQYSYIYSSVFYVYSSFWRSPKLFFLSILFPFFLLSYFFNIQELLVFEYSFVWTSFVLKSISNSCLSALFKKKDPGTFLMAQWLRLCSQCSGPGFTPWPGN